MTLIEAFFANCDDTALDALEPIEWLLFQHLRSEGEATTERGEDGIERVVRPARVTT